MTRTGLDARYWALLQVDRPTQSWYRLCLSFVRQSFGRPGGVADAGTAWDRAQFRHRTDNPEAIPADVPVWWELPSVADHVAYSLGGGWCLSNDILRPGKIDRVRIDTITRSWGGQLQGWAEDINGGRVWTPPAQEKPTPNITAYLEADNYEDKIAALRRVIKHGDGKEVQIATRLVNLHSSRQSLSDHIADARKELKREEVR